MTKSLKISENTHTKLKVYCANNKLKVNKWVEELILKSLEKYERNIQKKMS